MRCAKNLYPVNNEFAMVWTVILNLLLGLLILGTILVIIFDKGDPGRKVAWLMVVILLPLLGIVLYICFGFNQRHHWMFNRRHRQFVDILQKYRDTGLDRILFDDSARESVSEEYRPLTRMLGSESGLPPVDGNAFEIIREGRRKYDLLVKDLSEARESIHMEYFRFGSDKGSQAIREILIRKAREGVKVRFINENIGNIAIRSRYFEEMTRAGVEVVKFTNPRDQIIRLITRLNYRNHRKIVVIDNRIGYTGGMNINDKYFQQWRDTHLRILGPAVNQLQFIFLDSWITSGGTLDKPFDQYFTRFEGGSRPGKLMQIVPDEPTNAIPHLQLSYSWALHHARTCFYLQTPYFAPPESLLEDLKSAAASGVDVRIMLPEKVDTGFMNPVNRSYYRECLEAGIRIFHAQGAFMHSKTFVCDSYLSSIGSANLDQRSFSINYENNAYIYDRETALEMQRAFLEVPCREITLEQVDATPWGKRLLQKILRLFAPLL